MELTRAQVAVTLGCSINRVSWLVSQGRLTPLNRPKDPARRYVARFDDGAVRLLKREQGAANGNGHANGHTPGHLFPTTAPPAATRTESALQIIVAFAQVDADKRELLIKLGAKFSAQDLATLLSMEP